jgi:y4mF family transcriptional regulator
MYVTSSTPVQNTAELGVLIRAARKAQGITLTQAAMLCGVGVRFLSELENGKPTAEIGKVLHVLKSFGLAMHIVPRAVVQDSAR